MDDPFDDPHLISQIGLVQSPATTATTLHRQQMHQSLSEWPSKEQQQGIAALYALSDPEIFAYLTSLRSLTANLTNKQLKALGSLSSAPNDHIKTWLDCGRRVSGMADWKSIERSTDWSPQVASRVSDPPSPAALATIVSQLHLGPPTIRRRLTCHQFHKIPRQSKA